MADLLSEGSKSYIDALTAIEAFEGQVRGVCKEVYGKYKSRLVSEMGLKDAACEDLTNKDPANRYAELGARQSTKSGREWFSVYIMWDGEKDGAPETSACVCLDFTKRSDRDDYEKLLGKIPSIQRGDNGSYSLWSHQNVDLSSCSETFYKLLDEWLSCWPVGRRLK